MKSQDQRASRRDSKPKNWPTHLRYICSPEYSRQLDSTTLERLHAKPTNITETPRSNGPCANVCIHPITCEEHPAHGQYGLFSNRDLSPGSFIVFYTGFVHGASDTDPTSDYDLSLDRELGVGVDAASMGNEARFINDYRGISWKGPNAEFRDVWTRDAKGSYERSIAVFVLPAGKSGKRSSGIKRGQEILVSYGKGFWIGRRAENQDACVAT